MNDFLDVSGVPNRQIFAPAALIFSVDHFSVPLPYSTTTALSLISTHVDDIGDGPQIVTTPPQAALSHRRWPSGGHIPPYRTRASI